MRKPFEGTFQISQIFGNKLMALDERGIEYDYYAKWALNGHNGIDYACPTGTPILAPHAGTVIEANFDQFGYGNYVKIENAEEGSVLAHLDSIKVQVGFEVKEGDIIGISDNTGASTGPHLHWGYFKKPRNRQNGYDGFIDQLPILNPAIVIPEIVDGNTYTADQLKMMGIDFNITTSTQTVKGITFTLENDKKGGRILHIVVPEVKPTVPDAAQKTYTEGEYLKMVKERDDALSMVKTEHDNAVKYQALYTGFVALGYDKAEDVTNTIREYDKKLEGVKLQLSQQLIQNTKLADIISDKNKEDATAVEEGIELGHQVTELKDKLLKIGHEIGTRPENIFDILTYIKNIKAMAAKAFGSGIKYAKKEAANAEKKKAAVKTANTEKSSISSGLDWLMDFLFNKEVKTS